MMKPPFKASDGPINVIHTRWLILALCGLWLIKLYKHDFEVMNYISYVMPTCAI